MRFLRGYFDHFAFKSNHHRQFLAYLQGVVCSILPES